MKCNQCFVLKFFCMKIFRVVPKEISVTPSPIEEQLLKSKAKFSPLKVWECPNSQYKHFTPMLALSFVTTPTQDFYISAAACPWILGDLCIHLDFLFHRGGVQILTGTTLSQVQVSLQLQVQLVLPPPQTDKFPNCAQKMRAWLLF